MSAVDQIITDDKAPASVIERLQESGVDVRSYRSAAANRLRHRKERPGTESVPGRCVRGVRPREGRAFLRSYSCVSTKAQASPHTVKLSELTTSSAISVPFFQTGER